MNCEKLIFLIYLFILNILKNSAILNYIWKNQVILKKADLIKNRKPKWMKQYKYKIKISLIYKIQINLI